jgi:iron-sulfur cluster assembly protein
MLQSSHTLDQERVGEMVSMTDLAASRLLDMLREQDLWDHGLRIFVQGGGCAGLQYSMAFEASAREDDILVEQKGVRLFIDPFSARYLEGARVDYQDSLMGAGFRVDNPNAVAVCACGTSFRTEGGRDVEKTCEE